MAAPHVAGVVARILSSGACENPACVNSTLIQQGTVNKVKGTVDGVRTRFLYRARNL